MSFATHQSAMTDPIHSPSNAGSWLSDRFHHHGQAKELPMRKQSHDTLIIDSGLASEVLGDFELADGKDITHTASEHPHQ